MPSVQEETRQKGIVKIGDFVLEIKSGFRDLELVTLLEVRARGLKETGDLTFAIAQDSDYFGATAHIPEEKIPSDAIAYRMGKHVRRSNHASGKTEVWVPIAFYRE